MNVYRLVIIMINCWGILWCTQTGDFIAKRPKKNKSLSLSDARTIYCEKARDTAFILLDCQQELASVQQVCAAYVRTLMEHIDSCITQDNTSAVMHNSVQQLHDRTDSLNRIHAAQKQVMSAVHTLRTVLSNNSDN